MDSVPAWWPRATPRRAPHVWGIGRRGVLVESEGREKWTQETPAAEAAWAAEAHGPGSGVRFGGGGRECG